MQYYINRCVKRKHMKILGPFIFAILIISFSACHMKKSESPAETGFVVEQIKRPISIYSKKERINSPAVKVSELGTKWQTLTTINKTKLQKWNSSEKKYDEMDRLTLRLTDIPAREFGRHLYTNFINADLLKTGLLYNAGLHRADEIAINYYSQKKQSLDLNSIRKLAYDLKSSDNTENPQLPDFHKLINKAKLYYLDKKILPIIIVDVDFEYINKSILKSLRIDRLGRLHMKKGEEPKINFKNVYAYAPLVREIGYKNVEMVVDPLFIFTNKKVPEEYSVSINNEPMKKFKMGESFEYKFDKKDQEAKIKLVLREEHLQSAQALSTAIFSIAVPAPDLSWEPTKIIGDNEEMAWVKAHVYYSFNHNFDPGEPEIQNPLIILGGFDQNLFTNYARMYKEIAEIRKPDLIEQLRNNFDVILLTYRDVGVSIGLNARALAHTLTEINTKNNLRDGSILIGISMGGLVSRAALVGIENSKFSGLGTQHKVKLWISLDAPHQGAHIPVGLQYLIDAVSWLPSEEIEQVHAMLNSTSAKEMLIEHYGADGRPTTERQSFQTTLENWGSFPKNVGTTVGISSGALWTPRITQNVYDSEPCPENTGGVGTGTVCVPNFYWIPLIGNINSVKDDKNLTFNAQDNRAPPSQGLNMLSVQIGVGGLGVGGYLIAYVYDRATLYNPWEQLGCLSTDEGVVDSNICGIYTSSLVFKPNWGLELPGILDFFAPEWGVPAQVPAGAPYSLWPGGWLPTGENIEDAVSEINSVLSGLDMDTYSSASMPRHCFVPTISALDIPKSKLEFNFDMLMGTQSREVLLYSYGTPGVNTFFPEMAYHRGYFLYRDFIDFDRILFTMAPNAGKPIEVTSNYVCEELNFDPETEERTCEKWKKIKISSFDWIYFHNVNKQHGEMDYSAMLFVMDRIDEAISAPSGTTGGSYTLPDDYNLMEVPDFSW